MLITEISLLPSMAARRAQPATSSSPNKQEKHCLKDQEMSFWREISQMALLRQIYSPINSMFCPIHSAIRSLSSAITDGSMWAKLPSLSREYSPKKEKWPPRSFLRLNSPNYPFRIRYRMSREKDGQLMRSSEGYWSYWPLFGSL